jgi:hypothetical protein
LKTQITAAARAFGLFAILLAMTFSLQGCHSTLHTRSDLRQLTQRRGLGHVYYTGSKQGFDYFAEKFFLERTRYYRIPQHESLISKRFPKTNERSKWEPYLFNLGNGTEGFRHEEKIPILRSDTQSNVSCPENLQAAALQLRIAIPVEPDFPNRLSMVGIAETNASLFVCPATHKKPGNVRHVDDWSNYIYFGSVVVRVPKALRGKYPNAYLPSKE